MIETASDGFHLLRHCYREVVRRFIERFPDLVWLHAGGVRSDSGAIVLPGSWGRGKSSMVLAMLELDWRFLSDDVAPVDPVAGAVLPFPATPQVRKRQSTDLPRHRLGELPKWSVPLDDKHVARGPQPISALVLPHYRRDATAELLPVSPGEAVGELLENCLSLPHNEDETIRSLCAVVERLPVFRLVFGDAPEAARLIAERLGPEKGAGSVTGGG